MRNIKIIFSLVLAGVLAGIIGLLCGLFIFSCSVKYFFTIPNLGMASLILIVVVGLSVIIFIGILIIIAVLFEMRRINRRISLDNQISIEEARNAKRTSIAVTMILITLTIVYFASYILRLFPKPHVNGIERVNYGDGGYQEVPWEHNQINGMLKKYYRDGRYFEERYEHGKREGVSKCYYKEGGQLMSEISYKADKRNGQMREYYENDILKVDGFYKDDKKDDVWQTFYRNGVLSSQGSYIDGLRDGLWEEYFDNGSLKSEGSYKGDKKEGFWLFNTYLWGNEKHYYKESEGNYVDGKKVGIWRYYDVNGNCREVDNGNSELQNNSKTISK